MRTTARQPDSARIRVGAVDDHVVVLRGLVALLRDHDSEIDLVAVGQEVDELLSQDQPMDLVLLDIGLPGELSPEDRIARLTAAGLPVVLFTSEARPAVVRRLMRAGARGLALKSDAPEALATVIREVVGGGIAASSHLAESILHDESLVGHIAPRELEALQLLAEGLPKKSIGRHMDPPASAHTVDTYLQRVARRYAAMGRPVGNAYGSVREATRDGHLDT